MHARACERDFRQKEARSRDSARGSRSVGAGTSIRTPSSLAEALETPEITGTSAGVRKVYV